MPFDRSVKNTKFGLSYILGHPSNDQTKAKLFELAEDSNVSADRAWTLMVLEVIEELNKEDSQASLSSILSSLMERPVTAPKLDLLPYEISSENGIREHPMICFRNRRVFDETSQAFIEINKELADELSKVFQTIFDCEWTETVFVQ